ncbi:hypothetical protein [Ereboglobus luteus]|uniref:Lipoprotein n=1 Tax=Ereboglobus luteus TaxID=1796921 RepID=A0A2U8E0F6_9BACT|nr:hypothetical protein [Ereboglobus luteus]AWI08319.1 hypothetical protein CKA38_02760 [Ereboglobus luteus]
MKHPNITILTGLLLVLLVASCSKDTSTVAPPPAPSADAKFKEAFALPVADIFSVERDGEKVKCIAKIDFAPYKEVSFIRNQTGVGTKRTFVARLKPGVLASEDVLPDAKPYYYWLLVVPNKGKHHNFGPIRVAPDTDNKGTYVDVATVYKWKIERTYSKATISWSFPQENIEIINIFRKTSIANYAKRKSVFQTLEAEGSLGDPLPDPEADYWYWIEVTLTNGRIIAQGPMRAEFSR